MTETTLKTPDIDLQLLLSGVTVFKGTVLPLRTMYVSPDLFEILKPNPSESIAEEEK